MSGRKSLALLLVAGPSLLRPSGSWRSAVTRRYSGFYPNITIESHRIPLTVS